jgi:hypothetical protein
MYTVSATTLSNNILCTAQNSVYIDVHPQAQITASASRINICRAETTTLSVTGANIYKWTGAFSTSQSVFTFSTNFAIPHTFSVTGTDENGCTDADVVIVTVSSCVGLDELNNTSSFRIYPNPSQGNFIVEGVIETKMQMLNQLGQVIRTIELKEANNFSVNVNELATGIYFLTWTEGARNYNQKVIVEK